MKSMYTFCAFCGQEAEYRVCDQCGVSDWIIDCGDQAQPAKIAAGRADGSDMGHTYCTKCAHQIKEDQHEDDIHRIRTE